MAHLKSAVKRFSHLPVADSTEELLQALGDKHVVLTAPTGSGKTTYLPLAIIGSDWPADKKIIVVEPRRIAARAAASRMSQMVAEPVGSIVGYRTRFDTKVSPRTRVEVVTIGVLVRMIQNDPELPGIGLVIFDEFHERSLQADLALALCLDLCELREDLRLLIMSATLQAHPICDLLGNCASIDSPGKSYPVKVEYYQPPGTNRPSLPRQVKAALFKALQENQGDILVFLPGRAEIERCCDLLADGLEGIELFKLYGDLSQEQQDRVFQENPGYRRIILATPIAETSVTIPGISTVIDSGLCRQPRYDHASGLTSLVTRQISQAAAIQRTGRAGRTGPGHCLRLWSPQSEHGMNEDRVPEIIHADLTELVLQLALWGVSDPRQLRWLNPPNDSAWQTGVKLLQSLQLLDKDANLTPLGNRAASLPVHPRLAVILLESKRLGLLWTGCLLASALMERDLLRGQERGADIYDRVILLARFSHERPDNLPKPMRRQLSNHYRQAKNWFDLVGEGESNRGVATEQLGNLLLFGYPDRLAQKRSNTTGKYLIAGGRSGWLPAEDPLSVQPLLVVPHLDARAADGRIFLAAQVSPLEIEQFHSRLLTPGERTFWDKKQKRVIAQRETRIGQIIFNSQKLHNPDPEKVLELFLAEVEAQGIDQLPWDSETKSIQQRLTLLHSWRPDEWEDFSAQRLGSSCDWLADYCRGMTRLEQLRELDLKTILLTMVGWDRVGFLDSLAPTHFTVPSGSRIRISYEDCQAPVLAVRLQELFGLLDTPALCNGEIPLLIHLLSPARRPVQVTSDLPSFWRNTYPEVRRELAGRYPKHYWPEDPFTATPTRKTGKQLRNTR